MPIAQVMATFLRQNLRVCIIDLDQHHTEYPGDKNSTHPLFITSEISKGQVILSKALVL